MNIKLETRGLTEAMAKLDPKHVRRAASLAINEAARAGQAGARKEIRARWNIQAAKVNDEVKGIKFARTDDLEAVIQAKGRPISLTYFGAKEVRDFRGGVRVMDRRSSRVVSRSKAARGVTVQIERGKRTLLPKAFIATVKSGHVGVFERIGKARLPVLDKAVITIASMFRQARVADATTQAATTTWAQRFRHHLSRLLG